MAEKILGTDLFGNPVKPPQEGPGRPAIEWDQITSNRVLLCFVRGWGVADTAKHVGLSTPTLRKVYFSECAMRTTAAQRMEMRQLERLNAQAEEGSVAAEKELAKRIEALRMRDQHSKEAPKPKVIAKPRLGKKEEAQRRAEESTGLYDPPPAPSLVN